MRRWKFHGQAGVLRHWVQHPFLWCLVWLSLWCLPCIRARAGKDQVTQPKGSLTGRVTKGPMSPVIMPNADYAPVPVANVKIIVTSLKGEGVVSAVTNKRGYFRVVLTPGTYQVTLGPLGGLAFSKDVPAKITIEAEREARMEIHIDTGLR